MPTCTFFGHRDTGNEIEPILQSTIIDLIENKNVRNFYVGNHGGYDYLIKQLLIKLKASYPIHYTVVLAYLPNNKHNPGDEDSSNFLLPNGIEFVPRKFAINYRNKWMIDRSDYVITYVKYIVGGAAQFQEYAKKKNKIVINLAEK